MSRYSIAKKGLSKSITQKQDELILLQKELTNLLWTATVDKILEKEAVKFVVQCSYEALLKLVSIYHYYQSYNPNCQHLPDWNPDPIFQPSIPDAWACRNIPVIPKPMNNGLRVESIDSLIDTPHDPSCSCYKIDQSTPELKFSKDQVDVEVLYENGAVADKELVSGDVMVDDLSLSNNPLNSPESLVEESLDGTRASNQSSFTKFVKNDKEFRVCPLQDSKSKSHKTLKLPKIDVPPLKIGKNGDGESAVELPPIRMETKFFTKAGDSQDKKRKKW